jgi:amino acid transporter
MSIGPAESEPLVRRVTVVGLWALVINGTIGAGIFGLPAKAAQLTGIYSPLVLLLCGLLLLPIVLSFAEVASRFRGTGGPILYAHTAFGAMAGFQTGWAFYVARVAAAAANINLLVSSVAWFWEGAGLGVVRVMLLLLVCAALTWVNYIGSAPAMRSVGVLTALKFVPLLLLVGVELPQLGPSVFPVAATALPPLGDVGAAVLLLVYAYVGWESALVPAGEAREPTRDMPPRAVVGLKDHRPVRADPGGQRRRVARAGAVRAATGRRRWHCSARPGRSC